MPDSADMLWIYGAVVAAFAVLALVIDLWRRFRRHRGAKLAVGTVGERLLRRNGALPATTGLPASGTARAAAPAVDHAAAEEAPEPGSDPQSEREPTVQAGVNASRDAATGQRPSAPGSSWSMPRLQQTASRVLGEMSRTPPSIGGDRPPEPAKRPMRIAEDAEFLPAALEILETPPSPLATALMLGICAVFVTGLLWSIVGKLDIHAMAPGKIQPSGRTKVVQPLEAGRVAAIKVRNGDLVAEGDVLVELDPTEQSADLEALSRELESISAESARRAAAVAAARSERMLPGPIAFPERVGSGVRRRETELMVAELAQLRSTIEGFRAQIAEKQATKKRLTASIDARAKVIGLAKERVGMRDEIRTRGAGSRALVIEAELQYENALTSDAGERGQLAEADASMKSLEARMVQVQDQFIADQVQKGVEADRRRDRLEQEIIKARSKRDRTALKAPAAGIVQQVEVTTLGQVVASGQSLLSIVPMDAPLEVEVMVANKDIGFVRVGQRAVVKVEAFPFSRYGSIEAEVVRVSNDAVEERSATAMMDAASAARPQQGSMPRAGPGQNLVFPAILKLSKRTIKVDGKEIPLSPGMAVTAEVKTGDRRAISYILSPLSEILSTSGTER
ncbi:MAG: HlyD family type I secretion periplasmic adaptor subunit [Hyphomicrobiaceae bacterium]